MFHSFLEIQECLLHALVFIILAVHLDLVDVLIYDLFIIADRLNPDELIFAVQTVLQSFSYMLSPLFSGVRAIKDGDFVLVCVDKVDEVF